MDTHWRAPQLAYELAAEWAREMTACRGGGCGHRTPADYLGKLWSDLPPGGQRDVLAALSAQARGALWDLCTREGLDDADPPIGVDLTMYGFWMCERARATLQILVNPNAGDEWEMPQCPHCAALTAAALIDVHVKAAMESGIADPAAMLSSLAARAHSREDR